MAESANDDKIPLLDLENNERSSNSEQSHLNHPSRTTHEDIHCNEQPINNSHSVAEDMNKQIGISIPRSQVDKVVGGSVANATPVENSDRSKRNKLKYVALMALVAQNASLVLMMRYVKTRPNMPQFTNSTAVVCCETLKLLACLAVVFFEVNSSFSAWIAHLHGFLVKNFLDTLKVAVPAFIYVIQNNLLYIAVENLPAATFQVSYQIKILTTAIFSITMMGKDINRRQWLSLLLLFAGVAIVQVNNSKSTEKSSEDMEQSAVLGFGAVLLACCSSGFAGVYFEKILKGSTASLWTRNIQLGLFGLITGLMSTFAKDGDKIFDKGFFYGYDYMVWSVISIQALGGLLVAVVIKYADNILKGFACSVSIVVSAVAAYFIFEFEITWAFSFGTALVIMAVYLYSLPSK